MQNTTSQTGAAATAKNGRRYTFAALTEEQRREAIRVASNNGRQHCIGLEFTLTEHGHIACVFDVLTKHEPQVPTAAANKDEGFRVLIWNEAGVEQSRCTLGEFLRDNPDLVVDASDIRQAITHYGHWIYDGGAGGVFYLVPAPTDEKPQAVEEILRAATAWYGDAVPVKWLAVMPAMRAAPAMAEALAAFHPGRAKALGDLARAWENARAILGKIGGAS